MACGSVSTLCASPCPFRSSLPPRKALYHTIACTVLAGDRLVYHAEAREGYKSPGRSDVEVICTKDQEC